MSEKQVVERPNVLFIDNFDSFVFNLVDEFARRDCRVEVWRNNISADQALEIAVDLPAPRLIVLSPGPGTPAGAGCCVDLVRKAPFHMPIFGVCLGYQAIAEAFGGEVTRAGEVVHGKASTIVHNKCGLFEGLSSPMTVGRYHSLMAGTVPKELEVTARFEDMVMGLKHTERPIEGVQFHPESILTPLGGKLIDNLLRLASKSEYC
ncbi:MAG: aminodeoxychorismate/anthranilate synthase component II [Proteobacteria bacterium]|nr:aminodeoxychorismate/anthranilate synthase component II [Pseudomonadota bacterium]